MDHQTILLIEDNPDDEELTLLAFRKNNFRNPIVVARDGAEALEILFGEKSRDVPLPSMVLLDLNLPKIDGLEVLRRIRGDSRTRLLPVVVLTSSKEQRDLFESYSLGCNSYVRKPVSFAEFTEAARQLGVYWLTINQRPPATST